MTRHIACPTEPIYVKIMVLAALLVSYIILLRKKDGEVVNLADSHMDCLRGGVFGYLVVRIALLEYSKIHEKT